MGEKRHGVISGDERALVQFGEQRIEIALARFVISRIGDRVAEDHRLGSVEHGRVFRGQLAALGQLAVDSGGRDDDLPCRLQGLPGVAGDHGDRTLQCPVHRLSRSVCTPGICSAPLLAKLATVLPATGLCTTVA